MPDEHAEYDVISAREIDGHQEFTIRVTSRLSGDRAVLRIRFPLAGSALDLDE